MDPRRVRHQQRIVLIAFMAAFVMAMLGTDFALAGPQGTLDAPPQEALVQLLPGDAQP